MRFPPKDLTQHQSLPPWEELLPAAQTSTPGYYGHSEAPCPGPGVRQPTRGPLRNSMNIRWAKGQLWVVRVQKWNIHLGMREKAELGPAEGSIPGDLGCHVSSFPTLPRAWTAHSSPAGQLGLIASLLPHPCPALLSTSCLRVFLHPCRLLGPLSGSTSPPSQPLAQWSLAPVLHTEHILTPSTHSSHWA